MITTDICNLALSRIGARRIADFESDATTEARSCRLHYALVRDGLLRRHQWDFATRTTPLSKLSDAPVGSFSEAWQMPADCVRLISVSNAERKVSRFKREDRRILTSGETAVFLEYVSNSIPITQWDSLFIEALSLALAARIAPDVTGSADAGAPFRSDLESLALPAAQTADARETASGENYGLIDLIQSSRLTSLRYRSNPTPWADIPE